MTKVIYINGRFLTQPVTGVQRYSIELLRSMDILLENNPETEFICLTPKEEYAAPKLKNIEIRKIGRMKGNVWEQFDLPLYLKGELLFSPANIGPWHYKNQVVTFHDAAVFAMPQAYSFSFQAKYRFVFGQLAKNAKLIITDSIFSQKELAHYLKLSSKNILVVPLGSDHLEQTMADPEILDLYGLKKNSFLLTVASQNPHKNLARLIEAMRLSKTEMTLVMVGGSYPGIFSTIDTAKLPANIKMLGYLTDAQIKALYENASAFIMPSIYEGFGLPVLEAMRSGCAVLSSNAASLPEVGGEAVLYFNPLNVENIASTLDHFLSEPSLQNTLRNKSRQHALKFNWIDTAKMVYEAIIKI